MAGSGGLRRLLAGIGIANASLYALYIGVLQVLLPLQVEAVDRAHKVAALGLVSGVSAGVAAICNPLGGALSDRTGSRYGRRVPWLLAGAICVIAALGVLGRARSVLMIAIGWSLVQAVANFYQAALTAVVPDRVPADRRGTASAVVGVAMSAGAVAGVGLAGRFTGQLAWGYLTLGVLLAATTVAFVGLAPEPRASRAPRTRSLFGDGGLVTGERPSFPPPPHDHPARHSLPRAVALGHWTRLVTAKRANRAPEWLSRVHSQVGGAGGGAGAGMGAGAGAGVEVGQAGRGGAGFAAFTSALRHRDFAWVFCSRAAMILGYFLVAGFELYILTDYVPLPAGIKPATGVTILAVISTVCSVLAAAIAGPASDRLRRRKVFVIGSAALSGAAMFLPILSPTFVTMMVFAAASGLAFGCYLAVDTALVTLVLPRQQDAARDMGVLNVANAGPQIVAPFLAAVIIGHLGGYPALFAAGGAAAIAGALAIGPVRSVR